MEPNCFGIIKGEQPLIRASRASKVAGAFWFSFGTQKRTGGRGRGEVNPSALPPTGGLRPGKKHPGGILNLITSPEL